MYLCSNSRRSTLFSRKSTPTRISMAQLRPFQKLRIDSILMRSYHAITKIDSSIANSEIQDIAKGKPLLHYAPPPKQGWLISFLTGKKMGIVDLDEMIFGAPPRLDILHRVVVWQCAKMRAGTAKTKNRGEVRGGGRKPHRQKGTGRARQGSIRAPHFRGGGVVHGPRGPISYDYSLPKKVCSMALRTALSVKFAQGDLTIVDTLETNSLKTKNFVSLMELHNWNSVLLVDGGDVNVSLCRATANLQKVDVLPSRGLNVYNILLRDKLVLSVGAVRMLEQRLVKAIKPVA